MVRVLAFLLMTSSVVLAAENADAQARACMGQNDMRKALVEHNLTSPGDAMRTAGGAARGEVVRLRLCMHDQAYVYEAIVLKRDGKVARVVIDGPSGKVSAIR
jgi:uncharacterized membrane protein YkoI